MLLLVLGGDCAYAQWPRVDKTCFEKEKMHIYWFWSEKRSLFCLLRFRCLRSGPFNQFFPQRFLQMPFFAQAWPDLLNSFSLCCLFCLKLDFFKLCLLIFYVLETGRCGAFPQIKRSEMKRKKTSVYPITTEALHFCVLRGLRGTYSQDYSTKQQNDKR